MEYEVIEAIRRCQVVQIISEYKTTQLPYYVDLKYGRHLPLNGYGQHGIFGFTEVMNSSKKWCGEFPILPKVDILASSRKAEVMPHEAIPPQPSQKMAIPEPIVSSSTIVLPTPEIKSPLETSITQESSIVPRKATSTALVVVFEQKHSSILRSTPSEFLPLREIVSMIHALIDNLLSKYAAH